MLTNSKYQYKIVKYIYVGCNEENSNIQAREKVEYFIKKLCLCTHEYHYISIYVNTCVCMWKNNHGTSCCKLIQ